MPSLGCTPTAQGGLHQRGEKVGLTEASGKGRLREGHSPKVTQQGTRVGVLLGLGQGPRPLGPLGHHVTGHGCVIPGRSPCKATSFSTLGRAQGQWAGAGRNQQGLDFWEAGGGSPAREDWLSSQRDSGAAPLLAAGPDTPASPGGAQTQTEEAWPVSPGSRCPSCSLRVCHVTIKASSCPQGPSASRPGTVGEGGRRGELPALCWAPEDTRWESRDSGACPTGLGAGLAAYALAVGLPDHPPPPASVCKSAEWRWAALPGGGCS